MATAVTLHAFTPTPNASFNVRVVMLDGNPWFVAADVCRALGLSGYPADYTRRLGRDEVRLVTRADTQRLGLSVGTLFVSRTPFVALVSESGLYALIMRSDKPEARAFQDWVTREVLPSIRKHGIYVSGQEQVKTGAMSLAELGQRAADAYRSLAEALEAEVTRLLFYRNRSMAHSNRASGESTMQVAFMVIWLGLGVFQMLALMTALEDGIGLPGLLAFLGALALAYIPYLSPILAFFAIMKFWGWSWVAAFAVCFPGLIAFPLMMGAGWLVERRQAG